MEWFDKLNGKIPKIPVRLRTSSRRKRVVLNILTLDLNGTTGLRKISGIMGKTKLKKRNAPKRNGKMQALPFNTDRGQHILKNPGIINSIIEKSSIKTTDTVFEVGSGTGNLTIALMERAKRSHQQKLEVRQEDVTKMEWPFSMYAVLMFQKEFADRLLAKPGSKLYCRLSVEHLMKVKRTEFRPPPKVDSAVVRIAPKNPPLISIFRKNKTLLSLFKNNQVCDSLEKSYKALCSITNEETEIQFSMKEKVEHIITKSGFASKRARQMDTEDFLALLLIFNKENIHFV
ncbi:rRNA adenine N(6)-methyltransferase [Dirofilaria immitis]|nr:rRNA adenine N(6)-methyltransferase [Dirofilaria immitis]